MTGDVAIGFSALLLVVGVPAILFLALWLLGTLETWMVASDERAAEVHRLLEEEEPEAIEDAVAQLVRPVMDNGGRPRRV